MFKSPISSPFGSPFGSPFIFPFKRGGVTPPTEPPNLDNLLGWYKGDNLSGNMVDDHDTIGEFPLAISESPCATFDGVIDEVSIASLVGTETVSSYEGTGTPSISAGKLECTAGTLYHVVLSNGSTYDFAEKSGLTIYDSSGNGNNGTLTTSDVNDFWADTQDTYHSLVTEGFTLSGSVHIPADQSDPTKDVLGSALTNPPDVWNQAPCKYAVINRPVATFSIGDRCYIPAPLITEDEWDVSLITIYNGGQAAVAYLYKGGQYKSHGVNVTLTTAGLLKFEFHSIGLVTTFNVDPSVAGFASGDMILIGCGVRDGRVYVSVNDYFTDQAQSWTFGSPRVNNEIGSAGTSSYYEGIIADFRFTDGDDAEVLVPFDTGSGTDMLDSEDNDLGNINSPDITAFWAGSIAPPEIALADADWSFWCDSNYDAVAKAESEFVFTTTGLNQYFFDTGAASGNKELLIYNTVLTGDDLTDIGLYF